MAKWIEWSGEKPPYIEDLRCDMRHRNGEVSEDENSDDWWGDWMWANREPLPLDIMAYRVRDQ